MDKKPFWKSKTFILNIVAIALIVVQHFTGVEIIPLSSETETGILGLANVLLPTVTKTAVTLK